jgi:hypothetical protein
MRHAHALSLAAVIIVTALASRAGAGPVRIAGTGDSLPGFPSIAGVDLPAIDGGTVVFNAGYTFSSDGIFASSGGKISAIVTNNTPVPGQAGTTFANVDSPQIKNGTVVFDNADLSNGNASGVYQSRFGHLSVVASGLTPAPGGGTFGGAGGAALGTDGSVAFAASPGPPGSGIFLSKNGSISQVIRNGLTPIPGGTGTFSFFYGVPSISGNAVAVVGGTLGGNQNGVYESVSGSLVRVVDQNSLVPGSSQTFQGDFGIPSLSGKTVVFSGGNSSGEGIFQSTNGVLSNVLPFNAPIPGGTGDFTRFRTIAYDGQAIVFMGAPLGHDQSYGLYSIIGGKLSKVLAPGDMLDGQQVLSVDIGPEALSGLEVAFEVEFATGNAVYTENLAVPEPAGLTLAGLSAAAGLLLRRRRV